jgi:hypothetical protein
MTNAERFEWLEALKCNSFHLTRNEDHACNYVTAKRWIEEYDSESFADCASELVERMVETDTIWRLQVYPYTPIGFHVWHAPTAAEVVDLAIASGVFRK